MSPDQIDPGGGSPRRDARLEGGSPRRDARLDGIHHITAITADAPANVDFYVRVMGMRMIKKTINHDMPEVYHLYYSDEEGTPGAVLTFFEFPDVPPGRHGAGMVSTIRWRVGPSEETLAFWEKRFGEFGHSTHRLDGRDGIGLVDPEGLGIELVFDAQDSREKPLLSRGVPTEYALRGFDSVGVLASDPQASKSFLEALGFEATGAGSTYTTAGPSRSGHYEYLDEEAPRGLQGAGSVHHIAWACEPEEHADWRERAIAAGGEVTAIIDRIYFRSIYFREPSGVLFEIATKGPGFAVDEPLELLGRTLVLPERYEPLRPALERTLTPITVPERELH